MIAIPNDRLLALVPRGTSFFEGFKVADDLLRQAVQGISDIIITPGLINRDFSDIKADHGRHGLRHDGHRHRRAAKMRRWKRRARPSAARCSKIRRIAGSRGILINITGSSRLGLHEVNEACSIIREAAECDDVQINFGVILDESLADAVKITVIATGFQPENAPVADLRVGDLRTELAARISAPVIPMQPMPVAPPPPPIMHVEPEPELETPMIAEPEQVMDLDDLDTPAYLRQGRLLN